MPSTTHDPSCWRPSSHIRPLAIGIARRDDRILVAAVCQDDGTVKGWRPFGGGIEHGERSAEAVVRELHEELGAHVEVGERLGVIENIYTHHGVVGHEVVFVHEMNMPEPGLASEDAFVFHEDSGVPGRGEWRPLDAFMRSNGDVLFPEGLLELLRP